jgi:hypothetical protein
MFLSPIEGLLERFQNGFRTISERFQIANGIYQSLMADCNFAFIPARSCFIHTIFGAEQV